MPAVKGQPLISAVAGVLSAVAAVVGVELQRCVEVDARSDYPTEMGMDAGEEEGGVWGDCEIGRAHV